MLREAAEKLVVYLEERFTPQEPKSIAETGLDLNFLADLLLKNLYVRVSATGAELAEELGLPFVGVVEQVIEPLRHDHLAEVRGSGTISSSSYQLAITHEGRARARELMERSQYTGYAPVPLHAYNSAMHLQSLESVTIPEELIRHGLSHLVFAPRVVMQVGPAFNSGRAIFIHGNPGNGKTALSLAMGDILPGHIYIPHTISAAGQIIKLFDLNSHRPVTAREGADDHQTTGRLGKRPDKRWVQIRRPMVVVGGELQLQSLDLVYDPIMKTHEAPYQMKANGGIFLIDDFGRQQLRPRDLLNRWIMPLERRADFLTLNTGKKIEVPFDVLIIFSTNLAPKALVDEAFLRRIPHKIEIPDPGFEEFREIFKRYCAQFRIPYDEKELVYLLQEYYVKPKQPLRAVHARDILQQLTDIARFRRIRPELKKELIDEACRAYFLRY